MRLPGEVPAHSSSPLHNWQGGPGFSGVTLAGRRGPRFDLGHSSAYNLRVLFVAHPSAGFYMFVAVGMQVVAVLVLALLAGLFFDWSSAGFLILGGIAAIIPNGLFALRLASHRGKSAESYPAVFFLGEFGKIGLTAALLALIAKSVESISWLPLLIGLIAALQAPLFALMVVRNAESPQGDDPPGSNDPAGHATSKH
ncbi:MAG: ATP synthase subunit I [Burkholderiales bacterium]